MLRPRPFLAQPLLTSLLGLAFCVWSAFGNDFNFCVTAGCTLYQDTTVAGISMWWIGAVVFGLLGTLALAGIGGFGLFCSAVALLGDILLLTLLALTAPCLMCLIVAIFFALTYRGFRRAAQVPGGLGRPSVNCGTSVLLAVWTVLFIVNVGAVLRSESGVWPMLGDENDAAVHLYFSPSCPSCREAVEALSGNVEVAFYPLGEGEVDVYKARAMEVALDKGQSMAEALAGAQGVTVPESLWGRITPDLWGLRLRMLRNKAHVFGSGSSKVPFVEYRGLPSALAKAKKQEMTAPRTLPLAPVSPSAPLDDRLPKELDSLTSGNCPGSKPCN